VLQPEDVRRFTANFFPVTRLISLNSNIETNRGYSMQIMCGLMQIVHTLPVGGSASSSLSVIVYMENAYLENLLEKCILH
jgi:hypothetical protein